MMFLSHSLAISLHLYYLFLLNLHQGDLNLRLLHVEGLTCQWRQSVSIRGMPHLTVHLCSVGHYKSYIVKPREHVF